MRPPATDSAGSSPLARGLLRSPVLDADGGGIIPARAGFTSWSRTRSGRARDHPRSRGVYISTPTARRPMSGSSPLARGLPSAPPCSASIARIIPARAGFTLKIRVRAAGSGDHPRSRGVYGTRRRRRLNDFGSSPLARGLLFMVRISFLRGGIIPARAGFTTWTSSTGRPTTDHPRSRGVYSSPTRSERSRTGSSPLARGLRHVLVGPRGAVGIIPARAGFTAGPAGPSGGGQDHPRSRGVYGNLRGGLEARGGSSPLARGLRDVSTAFRSGPGIIPARAGFTPRSRGYRPRRSDHPRSRGVYACESLVSQRTRTLPDPCCLHCRPRARSAELR